MKRLLVFLILPGAPALAADAPDLARIPPPQAPYVNAVPGRASWTITRGAPPEESAGGGASVPGAVRVETVKDENLKHDVILYGSGVREEVWYLPDQVLVENSARPGRVVRQGLALLVAAPDARGAFQLLGNPVKSAGYPGFQWLDRRFFDRVVLFNRMTPSYHYVLTDKDPDTGRETRIAEAWVDAQTGAPLAYAQEGAYYAYAFHPPPESPLVLPAAFDVALLKARQLEGRQRRLEADAASLRQQGPQ